MRIQGELALLRARYTDKHSLIQGALRNLRRLQDERLNILKQSEPNLDIEQLWAITSTGPINGDSHDKDAAGLPA